jgi:hypothetical protein
VDELPDHGSFADADVVRQDHGERLVADQVLGHEHGVTEAQLLLLADVRELGQVSDRPDLAELFDLALLLEQVLELVVEIEVILDRALVGRGDDDDLLDPGSDRFLDAVLDDRLVDQRQHLLGLRLGRGQETGAPAGGREDSFADAHRTSEGGQGRRVESAKSSTGPRPGRSATAAAGVRRSGPRASVRPSRDPRRSGGQRD